ITGLGGQLTLGQFALAGLGAVASYKVADATGNFVLAFAAAALAAGGASLLIGIPALRIRGLMLAVTTLSFALASASWVLQQPWAFSGGVDTGRPIIGSVALESGQSYYWFALVVLALVFGWAHVLRSGPFGRLLIATRDNEDNVRAFGVDGRRIKLVGFLTAGAIAGIGGAVYAHGLQQVSSGAFPASASIAIAAMTVIGGLG